MFVLYLLIGLIAYMLIGQLLIRYVFPEKIPEISNYFRSGDTFHSAYEGYSITITRQENGKVYGRVVIQPFAGGPPEHRHLTFDEKFAIENGQVSVLHNGQKKKLLPGEELMVKKGEAHKFYNESNEVIKVSGEFEFPEKFAFTLTQLYGFMDEFPDFEKSPKVIFQITLFQLNGFDSYVANPPVLVQKFMGLLVTPISRLLGFRSYYKKYDPRQ